MRSSVRPDRHARAEAPGAPAASAGIRAQLLASPVFAGRSGGDSMPIAVRDADASDVARITELFDAIFDTTYEYTERRHTVPERLEWLAGQRGAGWPVLVALDDDEVVGVASYGAFRDNDRWEGYRFTVELTIHVAADRWRRGVGRALMEGLFERARSQGMRVIVAAIDSSNHGSITFHSSLGFVETARMPDVGLKWGRSLELVLMQRRIPDVP